MWNQPHVHFFFFFSGPNAHICALNLKASLFGGPVLAILLGSVISNSRWQCYSYSLHHHILLFIYSLIFLYSFFFPFCFSFFSLFLFTFFCSIFFSFNSFSLSKYPLSAKLSSNCWVYSIEQNLVDPALLNLYSSEEEKDNRQVNNCLMVR